MGSWGRRLSDLVGVTFSPLEKKARSQISQVPPRTALITRKTDGHRPRQMLHCCRETFTLFGDTVSPPASV